jgi:hypothetical protein
MPDYKNGKIYKIVCLNTLLEYIGSTCNTLTKRIINHVGKWTAWKQGKANRCGSFKILEGGNYKIELIEDFPCNNVEELHIRERHWFDLAPNPLCNYVLPYTFYTDVQKQRQIADKKRKNNPQRILNKKQNSAKRYLLRKELGYYLL